MKTKLILGTSIVLIACASYTLIAPTQADADRAAQKYPGTTLADLNQGKDLFDQSCGKCHSKKKSFEVSEAELLSVMPSMAKKSKLDKPKEDLVTKYLITMRPVQTVK